MRNALPRHKPLVQPPATRRGNFGEVIQDYDFQDAMDEADRCISCENARCEFACPLHNHIPRWIGELKRGNLAEAYRIIRETSPMPEICSRLCPQERLCEGACAMGIRYEAIAIGQLERFVSRHGSKLVQLKAESPKVLSNHLKKKAAAVGSGPASFAFAHTLAKQGHSVTVFERWPRLGGVLRWIPHFKLPTELLESHIEALKRLGVAFKTGVEIHSVHELLKNGHDAVFLGVGASRPSVPKIPGVTLGGILNSTDFLVRVYYDPTALPNGWQPITDLHGKRVAVLGGGDSAMDCLRTAVRLGASEVTCFYRRDEANMPGSKKEVKAAKEEGVRMQFLAAPTVFLSRDGRTVSQIECIRMELGPPDASGRRSPVPINGSNFTTDVDLVVLSFGYEVEPVLDESERLMPPPKGIVKINPATGATPIPGVFAGGDCVTGPNLVCTAARAGIVAAQGALGYFAGEPWEILCNTKSSK